MLYFTFVQKSGLYGVRARSAMEAMILIQKHMNVRGRELDLAKESLEPWKCGYHDRVRFLQGKSILRLEGDWKL